jgi:hypothetical protein
MRKWQALLLEIRQVHTEIMRVMPYRDLWLVPNPRASQAAIARAEGRVGRPLPPSYREFLAYSDGWPRFCEGASLLGTASLGKRSYAALAQAACEAAETPVPDLGPPSRYRCTLQQLVPFGIDMQATTLFAFNPAVIRTDGEYEVIAWVNELGLRRDSFEAFLEMVLELSQSELPLAPDLTLKIA